MNKARAIEVAKDFFPHYPDVDEFHVTADEQVFENKSHAENHVKSFIKKEDGYIVTVTKTDEDFHAEIHAAAISQLIVAVPDNSIVHTEDPATLSVVSDEEAQKQAGEKAKADAEVKAAADKKATEQKEARDKAAAEKKADAEAKKKADADAKAAAAKKKADAKAKANAAS